MCSRDATLPGGAKANWAVTLYYPEGVKFAWYDSAGWGNGAMAAHTAAICAALGATAEVLEKEQAGEVFFETSMVRWLRPLAVFLPANSSPHAL